MNKFEVGDRVVLVRPTEGDVMVNLNEGDKGTITCVSGTGAVSVHLSDGRLFWFRTDQLEHVPQEAQATASTLQERRERIATAVLAGFAASPGEVGYLPSYAKAAVEWADALIKELDK